MTSIKVGSPTLLTPVARIAGSPRIRCAEAAARSRSHWIHRLIIDGFSVRVREPGQKSVAEALSQSHLPAVIVRVSSRVDVGDRAELLIGPQFCGQRGLFDTTCKVAGSIQREIALSSRRID